MPPKSPVTQPPGTPVEAKLDQILVYMHRMDKRDKWRTIGGFFRGLIAVVPLLVLLGSAWYFVNHGAEFMKMIADQAAQSAAAYTKTQSQSMYEQFLNQYGGGTKK